MIDGDTFVMNKTVHLQVSIEFPSIITLQINFLLETILGYCFCFFVAHVPAVDRNAYSRDEI